MYSQLSGVSCQRVRGRQRPAETCRDLHHLQDVSGVSAKQPTIQDHTFITTADGRMMTCGSDIQVKVYSDPNLPVYI